MKGSRSARRQEKILQILVEQKVVSVNELAEVLDVSGWTVRRELNEMSEQGLVERGHGIVTMIEAPVQHSHALDVEEVEETDAQLQAKQRIGEVAAQFLRTKRHVVLGAGSTTTQVANALKPYGNLTIVTNGLNIAMTLSRYPEIEVICTGGSVHGNYYTLTGSDAERALRTHFFDVAVIGVSGITVKEGLTVNSQLNAFTLGIMIEQSNQVMIVADHTKIGEVRFAFLAGLASVDWLITDKEPDAAFCEQAAAMGIEIIVA